LPSASAGITEDPDLERGGEENDADADPTFGAGGEGKVRQTEQCRKA
jgi:hypothetical protein